MNPNRIVHFQHGLFGNVGTVTEIIIRFEAKQATLFFSRPFDQPFDGSSLSFQIGLEAPAVTRPISIIPIIMPDFFWTPELGCPKEIRHDYRDDGDWARYSRRFKSYLETQGGAIERLIEWAGEEQCCLLGLEADYNFCHRSYV